MEQVRKKNLKVEKSNEAEILPLKDFVIKQNDIYIELKKGFTKLVPVRFIQNLITEKVIKE